MEDGWRPTEGQDLDDEVFSAYVTREPPPWPRNHSANLAGALAPRPGFVNAEPSDHHMGVRRMAPSTRTLVNLWERAHLMRRRTRLRRRRFGPLARVSAKLGGRTAVCGINITLRNRPLQPCDDPQPQRNDEGGPSV